MPWLGHFIAHVCAFPLEIILKNRRERKRDSGLIYAMKHDGNYVGAVWCDVHSVGRERRADLITVHSFHDLLRAPPFLTEAQFLLLDFFIYFSFLFLIASHTAQSGRMTFGYAEWKKSNIWLWHVTSEETIAHSDGTSQSRLECYIDTDSVHW